MLKILMFIFSSFWHWLGFTIILCIVFTGVFDILKIIGISICESIEAAHPSVEIKSNNGKTEDDDDDTTTDITTEEED